MHKQLQANSKFLGGSLSKEVIPFQLPDSLGVLIMVVSTYTPHTYHIHIHAYIKCIPHTHTHIYHIYMLHITHAYSLIISNTYHTTHRTCHSLDRLYTHTHAAHIYCTPHMPHTYTHTPHNSHPLLTWSIMRGLLSAHTTSSSLMGPHMALYLESSPTSCPVFP